MESIYEIIWLDNNILILAQGEVRKNTQWVELMDTGSTKRLHEDNNVIYKWIYGTHMYNNIFGKDHSRWKWTAVVESFYSLEDRLLVMENLLLVVGEDSWKHEEGIISMIKAIHATLYW